MTHPRKQPRQLGKKIAIAASLALVVGVSAAVAWSVARSTPRVDLALGVGTPKDDVALAVAAHEGEIVVLVGPDAKHAVARFGDEGAPLPAQDLVAPPIAATFGATGTPIVLATRDAGVVLTAGDRTTPLRGGAPARVVAAASGATLVATTLDEHAVLERVDASGRSVWSRDLPRLPTSLHASADRSIVVVTAIPKDLGLEGAGEARATLLAIDASGANAWGRPLGAGSDRVEAVLARGAAADGALVVVGRFEGSPTIDGTTLKSTGPDDAWIGLLDDGGRLRGAHGFGLSFTPAMAAVAAGGDVYVAGARASDGGTFVARVTAEGRVKWAQSLGGPKTHVAALAVDARDRVLVAGSFEGSIRFARRQLRAGAGRDVFVARFGP